jgi:hypothetical protein
MLQEVGHQDGLRLLAGKRGQPMRRLDCLQGANVDDRVLGSLAR